MGVVHVLTGPDHLSAIATLSANVGNFRSFWYGVRWGIGHSIGLVVVGSIFIILSNPNDDDHHNHHGDNYNTGNNMNNPNDDSSNQTVDIPPLVESIGETFVGFFMLALGLYSMYKVWKKMQYYNIVRDNHHEEVVRVQGVDDVDGTTMVSPVKSHDDQGEKNVAGGIQNNAQGGNSSFIMMGEHPWLEDGNDKNHHGSISMIDMTVMDMEGHGHTTLVHLHDHEHDHSLDSYGATMRHDHEHLHYHPHHPHHHYDHHHHHSWMNSSSRDGLSNQFLSICIGIVHGVAGPGGVLGVIPAVQLHNIWLSTVYLGSFCITSILVMGCFAALYGMCSTRISESSHVVEIRMEIFSSSLSILVGSLWLILLSMGKLHDVFP